MLLFFFYLNTFCCWANWGIFLAATLQTTQFGRCCTCHCFVSPRKSRELHWCKCPCWSASTTHVCLTVYAGIHQFPPCFSTDDAETPGIANSGHSLSNTDLRHLFLKHPTPTSGENGNYNASSWIRLLFEEIKDFFVHLYAWRSHILPRAAEHDRSSLCFSEKVIRHLK